MTGKPRASALTNSHHPRTLGTAGRLSLEDVAAVTDLVAAATETDGVLPLSEHVTLHLRHGGDAVSRHVVMYTPDRQLAGYAHLDLTDEVEGASAELVVHPAYRGQGYGQAVLAEIMAQAQARGVRLWAHGGLAAARRLAEGMGFTRVRSLWQMRRSLLAPLPLVGLPAGVTLRAFRPGVDDDVWVDLNAKAFADHPEQGRWGGSDLRIRTGEPWFDPEGFLTAERDGRMVAFHWTKVHGGSPHVQRGGHGHDPIGEVYVVGVDPAEQGQGLGTAITLAGLRHLRARGLSEAMLYVDEHNTVAIRVYSALGFTHWGTDVLYRWQP